MNEKNKKNVTNEIKHTAEDIQLYRLFCIFGAAILGFALFRMVPYNVFSKILGVGQWIALGLFVLACAAFAVVKLVLKLDESGRIVTVSGIAYFVLPVLLMLACYRTMSNPDFKCQVAFGFLALFAAICNIFKKDFIRISAVTFLSIIAMYYASTETYNWIENVLAAVSMVMVFAIPVLFAVACLIGNRKIKDSSRFDTALMLGVCAFLLVCAAIVTFVPSVFIPVMIAVLIAYVLVGIVCTIRLI